MKLRKSKYDFKESSLPSNRKELFFDVIKNNITTLLYVGILLVLFSIPFIVVSILKDYYLATFYENYSTGAITIEEYANVAKANCLLFDGINIIALGILGIGVAGIIKIIKRLCFLDPVFFKEDFVSGIKDSGKHMFFLFAILGFVFLANDYASFLTDNQILAIIPSSVSYAIIYPTFIIMIMVLAVYNVTFSQGLYTSFALFVKSVFKSLLAYVVFIIPFIVVAIISNILAKYGVLALMMLIIMPILLVGMFDYCCSIFDVQINQTQYPEIYRKGLIDSNKQR